MESSQKSGVVGSIDLQSLEQMKVRYEEEMAKSRSRGQEFCKHRTEYKTLMDKLETITDKTTHEVMVPFTKKAFMPGHLVHTNEILVLLGDNWFVERSAKQAREIVNRRLMKCDETLRGIDQEIGLYENWLKEATQLAGDGEHGEGNIEIREEVDAAELERWRKERREKVREAKLKENQEIQEGIIDDEAYWKRLEELEMKEELDEYLENKEGEENDDVDDDDNDDDDDDDQETDDESESDSESEEEEGEEKEDQHKNVREKSSKDKSEESSGDSDKSMWQQMEELALEKELEQHFKLKKDKELAEDMSKAPTDRKVSFGENTEHVIAGRHQLEPEHQPKNVIIFDHSNTESRLNEASSHTSNSTTPVTPGDLYSMFGPTRARSPTKSILKQTSYPESQGVIGDDNDDDDEVSFKSKTVVYAEPAVADLVQERDVVYALPEPPQANAPTAKRQSLFKQNRRK